MLIAQTTGLDEATAKAAFSTKNQGKSIEEINKELEKSGKKKKSDKQRVGELRGEIERLVKSGQQFTGIWDAMTKGVQRGAKRWGWATGVTRSVSKGLRSVYRIMRYVTEEFLTNSEVGKKWGTNIKKFFSIFTNNVEAFEKMFLDFLDLVTKDPVKAWNKLIAETKRIFKTGEIEFGSILDSILDMFEWVFNAISVGVIAILGDMFKEGLKAFNNWLDDVKDVDVSGAASPFKPILDAAKAIWNGDGDGGLKLQVERLMDKLWEGVKTGWEKIKAWWSESWSGLFDSSSGGMTMPSPDGKTGMSMEVVEEGMFAKWTKNFVKWAKDAGDKVGRILWEKIFPGAEYDKWDEAWTSLKKSWDESSIIDDVGTSLSKTFDEIGKYLHRVFGSFLASFVLDLKKAYNEIAKENWILTEISDKSIKESQDLVNVYTKFKESGISDPTRSEISIAKKDSGRRPNYQKKKAGWGSTYEEQEISKYQKKVEKLFSKKPEVLTHLSQKQYENIVLGGIENSIKEIEKRMESGKRKFTDPEAMKILQKALSDYKTLAETAGANDKNLKEVLGNVTDSDRLKVALPSGIVDGDAMRVNLSEDSAQKFAASGMKAEFTGELQANVVVQIGDETLLDILDKYDVQLKAQANS